MPEPSDTPRPEDEIAKQTPATGEPSDASSDLDPRIPPASFTTLLTMLASQAMVAMGRIADPLQKKPLIRPRLARHFIDMIQILEEKSKGNVSQEEAQALEGILYELRMTYVSITKK